MSLTESMRRQEVQTIQETSGNDTSMHKSSFSARQYNTAGRTSGYNYKLNLNIQLKETDYSNDPDFSYIVMLCQAYNAEPSVANEIAVANTAMNYIDEYGTGKKLKNKVLVQAAESILYQLTMKNGQTQAAANENIGRLSASVTPQSVDYSAIAPYLKAYCDNPSEHNLNTLKDEAEKIHANTENKYTKTQSEAAYQVKSQFDSYNPSSAIFTKEWLHKTLLGEYKRAQEQGQLCARGREVLDKIRQANNSENGFSPALQMITAEVMANQSKTASLGAGDASNAYRRWNNDRTDYHYDVNGATSRSGIYDATGTTFHEFTHVAVGESYNNTTAAFSLTVSATQDDILKIRDERVRRMRDIVNTIPKKLTEHSFEGYGSYKGYVNDRADYGAFKDKVRRQYIKQETDKLQEELCKAYESNNADHQKKAWADADQFEKVLEALNSVDNPSDNALIEYDSVINQMLIAYEMMTKDRSSEHYRKLKAAALRAHVERHNAKLRQRQAHTNTP